MKTGTFTHKVIAHEKLNNAHKNVRKSYKMFKPGLHVFSTGTNIVKIWFSLCLIGCVRFTRYCGKMYSRHLFSYVDWISTSAA